MVDGLFKGFLKSVQDTRLTYFIVLTGASFIGILHLLPQQTQMAISQLARAKVIMAMCLIGLLWLGYHNCIGAIILLVLYVCAFMPFSTENVGTEVVEGFKSSTDAKDNELSSNNKVIRDLFGMKTGPLRKELEKNREVHKELFDAEVANNKFMEYEHRKKKKKAANNNTEKFQDTDGKGKGKREIQQRKFNPGDKDDVNLLSSMEIFDDIKDRIKYNYEDNKYLKRYIKEKLEEVVDMLDLVPDSH